MLFFQTSGAKIEPVTGKGDAVTLKLRRTKLLLPDLTAFVVDVLNSVEAR